MTYQSQIVENVKKRQNLTFVVLITRHNNDNQRNENNITQKIVETNNNNKIFLWFIAFLKLANEINILKIWNILKSRFFTLSRMIKDVLVILIFDVDVERLFFITRNVIIYRRNRFRKHMIENIMIIKHTNWFVEITMNDVDFNLSIIAKKLNENINEINYNEFATKTTWISKFENENK